MNRRLALLPAALLLLLALPYAWAAEAPPAAKPAPDKTVASEPAPPELVQVADEVAKDVEAIRGWKFKARVKTAVCSPEQVRAYMHKQIDKHYPATKVDQIQASLRLVGLIPEGCDLRKSVLDLMETQVEGFYDTDTKTLYMVKREAPKYGSLVERILIAHELTHALDDQHVDLKRLIEEGERREDTDMAHAAVAEGSASSTMTRYMLRAQAGGQADPSELQQYIKEEAARNKAFLEAPPYFQTLVAAYVCGMNFLTKGNPLALAMPGSKDVGEELQAAAKDPPQSTKQILHPETYWVPEKREVPILVSDKDAEAAIAVPGYQVIARDVYGELLAAVLTTPKDRKPNLMLMGLPTYWTNPAADGWGGDRFFLLAPGKTVELAARNFKDTKGVWITFWNTPEARDKFVEAYDGNSPSPRRTAYRLGNMGAVFFYNFTDAERAAAEKRLGASPPKCTRDGKPWAPWSL